MDAHDEPHDVDRLMNLVRQRLAKATIPNESSLPGSGAGEADAANGGRQPALLSGGNGLSVADVLRRLRGEVARLDSGNQDNSASNGSEAPVPPRWLPAAPRVAVKREYALAELLSHSDADFIDTAYQVVMRRPSDPEGRSYFLRALRDAELTKIEILAALRWSPEGRTRSVHIDGLLIPYTVQRIRRWPVLGPLLAWAMDWLRLPELHQRLHVADAAHARESHELGATLNDLGQWCEQTLAGHSAALEAQRRQLLAFEQANASLLERLQTTERELDEAKQAQARHRSQSEAEHSQLQRELTELRGHHDQLHAQLAERSRQQQELAARIDVMDELLAAAAKANGPGGAELDALYADLEKQFRGSEEDIKARALPYLDIVRAAGVGQPQSPIVDLGCGRGEWLELLREQGFVARGVEINTVFAAACQARGLQVVEAEALAYLHSTPDQSLGAVTAMHVAEHLPFASLLQLLDEARRVLQPGGVLILETPNPENMLVGMHHFYLDPTHRHPLPPALLQWLAQSRGFTDVRVERLSAGRGVDPTEPLDEAIPGAAQINRLIALLKAAPDYAIVAYR